MNLICAIWNCTEYAVEGDPLGLCRSHGGTTLLDFEDTWRTAA